MGQAQIINFPKNRSVAHPDVLHVSLVQILKELFTYYDCIADFVEDCAQARGLKSGIQADRTLHSWARRQLAEYQELKAVRG